MERELNNNGWTNINVYRSVKEELKMLAIEESMKKGNRIALNELITDLIDIYRKENKSVVYTIDE